MRTETISSTDIIWRDERQGLGELADARQLRAVFTQYGAEVPATLPVETETEEFRIRPCDDTFPCRVIIERKPRGPVQEAAWSYCEDTRMARIVEQDGALGMLFLDEDVFVPFNKLSYDSKSGFSITS